MLVSIMHFIVPMKTCPVSGPTILFLYRLLLLCSSAVVKLHQFESCVRASMPSFITTRIQLTAPLCRHILHLSSVVSFVVSSLLPSSVIASDQRLLPPLHLL